MNELAHELRSALARRDMPAAVTAARSLASRAPGEEAQGLLAATLMSAGEYRQALPIFRELSPNPERLIARARCTDDAEEAVQCLRLALELDPDDEVAKAMLPRYLSASLQAAERAHEVLRQGDLVRGFRMLEAMSRMIAAPSPVPWWKGQRVGRLLVMASHGDGDCLQFLRYVQVAKARCDRLTLAARRPLLKLLQQNGIEAGDVALWPLQDLARQCDAQHDLMLLPAVVGGGYGKRSGYIRAMAPRDYGPGYHVGVNWVASETRLGEVRTVDADALAPLAGVPGVTFHCLTFGERARQAPAWVRQLALGDYAETADAVAGLDLVITVDSSPAHLAGALGVPVWVALPGPISDWRFETQAHKWRWYDCARLFRGPQAFERMASMLAKRK